MSNPRSGFDVRHVCPQSQPVIKQDLLEELSKVGLWGRDLVMRSPDTDGVGSGLKRRCDTASPIPHRYQVHLVRSVVVA